MIYLRSLYLCLLVICFAACRQGQPTAVLEIYVLDPLGNRVDKANINIYRTREDWNEEKNPAKTAEVTSLTGLIRFVNLEAGTYYIDVKKDSLNNWEGKVETTVKSVGAFYVNTEFVIVKDSKSSDVASSVGKRWQAITVKQFDRTTPVTMLDNAFRCRLDNVLIFYKSGRYDIEGKGIKCSVSETAIEQTGTWSFNDTGTRITIKADGRDAINWTVISSSKDRLIFQEVLPNPFFGLTNSDITYILTE
ncbi:MAG: hypothetical protein EAZ08_09535 [Cytophagales bacterium]|nr:MAG: hypothetical protein EAZ08_09535 [Cytophagales bacterium]